MESSRDHVGQRVAELSPGKRELLLARLRERRARALGQGSASGIQVLPRSGRRDGERFPLSFSQIREWILDRMEPGSAAYNIPLSVTLSGSVDVPALAGALATLVERHESLRTCIRASRDGSGSRELSAEPVQVVLPWLRPGLPVVDLASLPEDHRAEEARRLEGWHAALPFALDVAPLFRSVLLHLHSEEHWLLLSIHHIIADGWSMGVLFRDLGTLYRAAVEGKQPALPELPVQYGDFAAWQRRRLTGELLDRLFAYWRDQLRGASAVLELPADRPRSPGRVLKAGIVRFRVASETADALRREARRHGASLFMVLLAALDVLLFRLTGQTDLPVGTYIANRTRTETANLIGFFVNTLVLRARLDGDPSLGELVQRVRRVTLDAYEHQDLPFEKLLELLKPERDPDRTPLFQVLCVLQNTPGSHVSLEGLSFRGAEEPTERANFDLSLFLVEDGGGIVCTLDYDRRIFDPSTVRRWGGLLSSVLDALAFQPDSPLSTVPGWTRSEHHQVCREWGEAGRGVPPGPDTVVGLLAARAEETPEATALESVNGDVVSYGALWDRARELAGELGRRGAGRGSVVGVHLAGGPDAVTALLGVLAAGAAYLPLDPDHPERRTRLLVEDCGVSLMITAGRPSASGAPALRLVEVDSGGSPPPEDDAPGLPQEEDLAYVLYTSGSTGMPKGVEVRHRSLASYCRGAVDGYELRPGERMLQFAALSFDASAEEIYPCLASGATLVFRDAASPPAPGELLEFAERRRLTVLDLPTAYWHRLAAALPDTGRLSDGVRLVIIGGEAARAEAVNSWRRAVGGGVRLVNSYGPTEATIVSSWTDLTGPVRSGRVPIGRPVPGVRLVAADRDLRPVPIGAVGEILIGGAGVARGYRSRPALTAERFVPDPWERSRPGARVYRSGDLGRCGAAGDLEFVGRIDHQVKVRGYRIEPGEVEAVLARIPGVREAAVLARREGAGGGSRLVAYVVADGEPPPTPELRRLASEHLPAHMVPAAFEVLPALPLTAHGKVDRGRLPEPGSGRPELGVPYAAPRNPAERELALLWKELLEVDRVGIHDNFFDLGGDSLLLLQAYERLSQGAGAHLTVIDLFRYPTIEALAAHIDPPRGGREEASRPVDERVARQRKARALRRSQTGRRVSGGGFRRDGGSGRGR